MKRRRLRKKRVAWFASTSGSVSIYFITATASFVLLTALLIDFSRIAAFRKQAELAVQAGVRSVLSSYDSLFYEKYGLFIRGGEDGRELFLAAAQGNFTAAGKQGVFSYLDAEWADADVTESRPLADFGVFRRQVLEEMKYKAPIDLSLELVNRFRGVSPAMKEAASTVDVLEQMRQAYDRREAALDETLTSEKQAGTEIISLLRNLASDIESAITSAESGSGASVSIDMEGMASRVRSSEESSETKAKRACQRANEANEEMRTISGSVPGVSSADGGGGTVDGPGVERDKVDAIADIRRTAKELVLDAAYFENYNAELTAQADRAADLAAEIGGLAALVSGASSSAESEGVWREVADRLLSAAESFGAAYGPNGDVIRSRHAMILQHRSRDEERKAQEKAALSEWSGWNQLIGGLNGRQDSPEDRKAFRAVDQLAQDNLQRNGAAGGPAESSGLGGDPAAGRDRSITQANGALDVLAGSLNGVRDAFYFSEYAAERYTSFPPTLVKRMLQGEAVATPPGSQQFEYVLYGFADPLANIAAAYGEMFAFRLAVRTMEGLVECRAMGHPLLVLAAALVYGIRNAVLDIHGLLERGTIPLSKYVKADTVYTDYLRLFLLLHGGSPACLSRSIAVMEYETGLSFTETYTYVSGEGTATLRLWFFPGLLKLMNRTGQLGGAVKGNRYEASYTADSSYQ